MTLTPAYHSLGMIVAEPYAARGYVLLKLEPHLHTLHSDGQDGVRAMLQRGGRLAPIAAGDVHSRAAAAQQRPATYVYVRERSCAGVLEALAGHRLVASTGEPPELVLEHEDGAVALVGEMVAGTGWIPRASAGATVETLEIDSDRRAVYAVRRDAQGKLEGVTAPIWIDTSH